MLSIRSRQNPIIAEFHAVARRRAPAEGTVLLDGRRLVEEALAAGVPISTAAFTAQAISRDGRELAAELGDRGARLYTVSDAVMAALSPVQSPSGIVALGTRLPENLADALARPPQLVVVAAGVQDPGNLGAVVRSAEAAGATGVVVSGASTDPFGWKALRGAMGSAFRVPIAVERELDASTRACHARGIRVLAAVPASPHAMFDLDLTGPVAFLVGAEGSGLPRGVTESADAVISIPMRGPVQSLNVAVAAALLLFEARRQRDAAARPDGARPPRGTGRLVPGARR